MKTIKTFNNRKMRMMFLIILLSVAMFGCGGGGSGGGGNENEDTNTESTSTNSTSTSNAIKLSKTGQTTSYATGDDGFLKKGVAWPDSRFTIGTGTEADCITDNLTGLMWPKSADSTQRTWQQALDYSNNLTLCGHNDWRLPNKNELQSL